MGSFFTSHGCNKVYHEESDESIVPHRSTDAGREEPLEVEVNECYRSREKRRHKTLLWQWLWSAGYHGMKK